MYMTEIMRNLVQYDTTLLERKFKKHGVQLSGKMIGNRKCSAYFIFKNWWRVFTYSNISALLSVYINGISPCITRIQVLNTETTRDPNDSSKEKTTALKEPSLYIEVSTDKFRQVPPQPEDSVAIIKRSKPCTIESDEEFLRIIDNETDKKFITELVKMVRSFFRYQQPKLEIYTTRDISSWHVCFTRWPDAFDYRYFQSIIELNKKYQHCPVHINALKYRWDPDEAKRTLEVPVQKFECAASLPLHIQQRPDGPVIRVAETTVRAVPNIGLIVDGCDETVVGDIVVATDDGGADDARRN